MCPRRRRALRPWWRLRGWVRRIGASNLYIKNDAVCMPTLSFKDRVVAVALANAQAFRIRYGGLLLDREPGQRRGCPCGAPGPEDLHPRSRRSRAGQDSQHAGLRRHAGARRGQLRSCQPAQLADRRSLQLGLRECEPAAVLRRGLEDGGLRDRRATGLAAAR